MRHTIVISAGNGPIEVREFVAKLAQQAENRCLEMDLSVLNVLVHGEEEAPSSVEIAVEGQAALIFGDWIGTHELVARSEKRTRNARKRWFSGLFIEPHQPLTPIDIQASDVDFVASRSGGPGGQHVNTTSSAIRAHHRPSGIRIRVTEERSQQANKRLALKRIGEVLAARLVGQKAAKKGERHLKHRAVVRGNAVKSWSLAQDGSIEEKA